MKLMTDIKPKIVAALKAAGYTRDPNQQCHEKWCLARANNVWFNKRIVRANAGTSSAKLVRKIAGRPNGSATIEQQDRFDSWYTDGYRSRGTAAL